jgi:uncharacterized protein
MSPKSKQVSMASSVPQPWWRFGHVWLVLAGPAVVVVAGLVTAWIAVNGADPVISAPPAGASGQADSRSLTPAHKARNLAADHAMRPAGD